MSNVIQIAPVPVPTFDDFWRVYPRRKDKLDAQRAWAKALKIATAEEIIEGAKRYAKTAEAPFIKLPATFLNKGSWMDEELQALAAVDATDSRLLFKASQVKAAATNKFAADWVKNNVTPQDVEEMKRRGMIA